MKFYLLITLILLSHQDVSDDAANFLKGFLKGIKDLDIDFTKISFCITNVAPIINKIEELALRIESIDDVILYMGTIYEDIVAVIAGAKDCLDIDWIYQELLLLTPDKLYEKLGMIIIFNFNEVRNAISKIIMAARADDYQELGYEIGYILSMVFDLSSVKDPREAILKFIEGYMVGFFQGIDVDYPKIMACITNSMDPLNYEILYNELVDAIKKLENIDILHLETIQKAIEGILLVVKTMAADVKPCIESFPELQQYWDKILLINPFILAMQVTKNIILHGGQLFNDLKGIYTAYMASDWFNVGKDIGDFIYTLILKTLDNYRTINDDIEFIKGIFEGLKQDGEDVQDILQCIDDSTTIIKDIEDVIYEIKKSVDDLKNKKIEKLIGDFAALFSDIRDLFVQVEPCATANKDIMKIINIFKGLTAKKIAEKVVMNLIKNAYQSYEDISKMVKDFENKQYNDAGKMLGDIIYRVFLA